MHGSNFVQRAAAESPAENAVDNRDAERKRSAPCGREAGGGFGRAELPAQPIEGCRRLAERYGARLVVGASAYSRVIDWKRFKTIADSVGALLMAEFDGDVSVEHKMDGARIQVHKAGDEVKVYSRNLRDVTVAVPEIVTAASLISNWGSASLSVA